MSNWRNASPEMQHKEIVLSILNDEREHAQQLAALYRIYQECACQAKEEEEYFCCYKCKCDPCDDDCDKHHHHHHHRHHQNIRKTKPNAAAAASSGIDQQGKKITVFQDGYKTK